MRGYFLIVTPLLIIISVLISLNIFFQHSLQNQIANDFNLQQQILAESVSKNIKEQLENLKVNTLLSAYVFSKINPLQKKDNKDSLSFSRIIFTNTSQLLYYEGKSNISTETLKKLTDRLQILPYNTAIFYEIDDFIYCVARIIDSNNFIALFINSTDLAKETLSNIQTAQKGNIWILTSNGDLLYHPTQPDMAGRNIYSKDSKCIQCHQSFDFEKNIIEDSRKIKGKEISYNEERLIAYSKINIDNVLWTVFLSANYSNVIHIIDKSMKVYSYLILTILTATIIFAAILYVFNKKRLAAKELEIREHTMRKYADALEENVNIKTAALIEEREKLTTILNAIGAGIILIDTKGKILWANEKTQEMFDVDVVGKYCEQLWVDCDISGVYTKGNFETSIISINNDKFLQVITAPIKNEQGEIYRYIRLIQDITEIKKMEEQITNSEKLASIGRLAAGIAHEIGNPLTSIFSYVQILKSIEDDKFKKESLETIYFHIQRISEILKQLSSFTKMSRGETQLISVNEIIEDAIKLIRYDKRAKNIVIKKNLSDSIPKMNLNFNQLSQVFINLILNAIDAMPDGGQLTINSYLQNNDLVIDFSDTGIGISRENLSKIFDPFYTTKEKGTGLGLAVSYNIITKMEGQLTVESEVGKGTTFKISLPIKKLVDNLDVKQDKNSNS
ncbi:MAG: ATP-binding protein [Thermodesulfovibrionales bacterium]|nr:ATP-binding protein [Thermodesulfovibrionales bacterium]